MMTKEIKRICNRLRTEVIDSPTRDARASVVLLWAGAILSAIVTAAQAGEAENSAEIPYEIPTNVARKSVLGTDGVSRRDPSDVIKVDGVYYLWYTKVVKQDVWNPSAEHYPHGYPGDIWYATSSDGLKWEEQGEAVSKGARNDHDEHGVFTPNILVADSKYYLFYTAVDEPYVWEKTPTTINVAVSDSPAGPWRKHEGNPVLRPSRRPDRFDSFRIDDASFVARDGAYWMYYKGRPLAGNTSMGVAIADHPLGPYQKYNEAESLHSGHEVLVWPTAGGVASYSVYGGIMYFAADGVDFKQIGKMSGMGAPGLYRSDHFRDDADMKPEWGITHGRKVKDGLELGRVDWIYDKQ